MEDAQKFELSDSDRASFVKYYRIAIQAQAAGVALRELQELRRDLGAEINDLERQSTELAGSRPRTAREIGASIDAAAVRQAGSEAVGNMITRAVDSDRSQIDARTRLLQRRLAVTQFRIGIVDAELPKVTEASRALSSTRAALQKHLVATGTMSNEDR